ncbi:L-ascorbate peroxidase 3 [Capsicum galapagoense]
MAPRVDKEYRDEIEKVRTELHNIAMSNDKSNAPHLLRLAYASQFSIANSHVDDAATKPTQSDDTISTLKKIQKIKADHPIITHPDLYQLAGIVAVEILDGPKMEFVPGRTDSSILPDESCLPDVKQSASDLRKVFGKVGISEPKHIVALCGGLKLARSGPVLGPSLKFDDPYYLREPGKKKDSSPTDKPLLDKKKDSGPTDKPLLNKKKDSGGPTNKPLLDKKKDSGPTDKPLLDKKKDSSPTDKPLLDNKKDSGGPTDKPLLDNKKDSGPTDKPLLDKKKDSGPTDNTLLDDPKFRECVQRYARDKEVFFKDYEEAHKKLSEFGLPHSSFIRSVLEKSMELVISSTATQRAVAAAVAIFGVFYLINRRRAKHSQQLH